MILLVDELRPSPVLERLAHRDHSTGATSQEEMVEAVDEEELVEAVDEEEMVEAVEEDEIVEAADEEDSGTKLLQ